MSSSNAHTGVLHRYVNSPIPPCTHRKYSPPTVPAPSSIRAPPLPPKTPTAQHAPLHRRPLRRAPHHRIRPLARKVPPRDILSSRSPSLLFLCGFRYQQPEPRCYRAQRLRYLFPQLTSGGEDRADGALYGLARCDALSSLEW